MDWCEVETMSPPPIARIPRWVVENDPSWEKSIDSNPMALKWNKKGTGIKAISHPTSIYCDITTEVQGQLGLSDILPNIVDYTRHDGLAGENIIKYLSSRYLNPRLSKPFGLDNMV
jgi:hypothetical protein